MCMDFQDHTQEVNETLNLNRVARYKLTPTNSMHQLLETSGEAINMNHTITGHQGSLVKVKLLKTMQKNK